VQAAKLRALGIAGQKSSALMPDLPILGDAGMKNGEAGLWFSLLALARWICRQSLSSRRVSWQRSAGVRWQVVWRRSPDGAIRRVLGGNKNLRQMGGCP
jgi:Tripartite tricarboxylate transporter family receptor